MNSSESIRARVKRRVRVCAAVAVLGWLCFPASAAINAGKPQGVLVAAGMVLFLGAVIAFQYAAKCPRCRTRMGQEMGMRTGLSIWGKARNFCPYCGVNLDEPCSKSPSPNEAVAPAVSQNPIR